MAAAELNERGGKKQERRKAPFNYGVALTRNEEKSAGVIRAVTILRTPLAC